MIKRIFLTVLCVLAAEAVERRSHHRYHHKRPHQDHHSISETVEDIEKSFPVYSEKQKQALAKFEDHKIFQEVWQASKNRVHERMRQIEERRRKHHRDFSSEDDLEM